LPAGATGGAFLIRVTHQGAGYLVLVLLTGPITAVPLLLFGAAATRVSMTTLGLLNYIAPIMQFIIGVLVFHEAMSTMRWAGFGLVWLALVIFTWDSMNRRRQNIPATTMRMLRHRRSTRRIGAVSPRFNRAARRCVDRPLEQTLGNGPTDPVLMHSPWISRERIARIGAHGARSMSSEMSTAGAECVSAPTAM
jgi:hypothetical protein